MEASLGINQDLRAVEGDWAKVGGHLTAAMLEVATEIGGEELASSVALQTRSDGLLPDPAAFKTLESLRPGSAKDVMSRLSEIQQQSHEREKAELRKPIFRGCGKAILRGFVGLNPLGSSSKNP